MKSNDKIILIKILGYITELEEFIKGYSKEQSHPYCEGV